MGAPMDPRHGLSLLNPARVHHVVFAAEACDAVLSKRGRGGRAFVAGGGGSQAGAYVNRANSPGGN